MEACSTKLALAEMWGGLGWGERGREKKRELLELVFSEIPSQVGEVGVAFLLISCLGSGTSKTALKGHVPSIREDSDGCCLLHT